MKTKKEKVLDLTPITMKLSDEAAKIIAKNWSTTALDYMIEMWHKYYTTTHHLCINSLLINFTEKEVDLSKLDNALAGIKEVDLSGLKEEQNNEKGIQFKEVCH